MKAILIGAIVAMASQGGQPKLYEHAPSNLKFSLAGPSKLAKKKGDWIITFPVGEAKGEATLQIFAVSFMADPEVWEITQKYFVEQQRMNMLQQSREEILGVPLLLAKMQETATLDRKITLSGLIYAASDFKFAFRLTAKESDYPAAEAKWRETMLSLATIDGQLPVPETPNRKPEAPAIKNKPVQAPNNNRTTIGSTASGGGLTVMIGEVAFAVTTAGKKVELRLPKGFAAREGEGTILVAHPELGSDVRFTVASTLDSPPMSRALADAARTGLEAFTTVRARNETLPKANGAGAVMARIWREGQGAAGPLYMAIAGGEKSDYYWLARVEFRVPPTKRQWEVLEALLQGTSVEPAP